MDTERHDTKHPRSLRRRDALGLIGGAGLTGLLGGGAAALRGADGTAEAAAASCVLTPEVTEGPYWIDDTLTRRDIREGKAGLPLVTTFTVRNARTCRPIAGADLEIWHCDAVGEYSGGQFDTSHAEDSIFAAAGRARAVLDLAGRSAGRKGYRGAITLAVAT
jgi:hypothetical protein